MKQLLILFVLLLFSCPKSYADNDPTKEEITQAQEILLSGIDQKDPKKAEKIALVVTYLTYEASIGNQNALIASTEFLSNYEDALTSFQKYDIKAAQEKIVSSYIQSKDLVYSDELFVEKTKDLLSKTRAFENIRNIDATADQAATVWFKYIVYNFDAYAFKDGTKPGINRLVADQIVAENGLFAYMLNKIKTVSSTDKKLKDAYYVSLLAINEIIISDANSQKRADYKGFKIPDICFELRTLKEYEETMKDINFRFAAFKEAAEGKIYKSVGF